MLIEKSRQSHLQIHARALNLVLVNLVSSSLTKQPNIPLSILEFPERVLDIPMTHYPARNVPLHWNLVLLLLGDPFRVPLSWDVCDSMRMYRDCGQ